MITKTDILDHINNNYGDCINNIHIFKESIIEDIVNISKIIDSSEKNENQSVSERYFIKSIVEEYIEEIKIFDERRNKFHKLTQLKCIWTEVLQIIY